MTYKITPCSLRLATAERDPSSLFYFALKLLGTLFPPSLANRYSVVLGGVKGLPDTLKFKRSLI